MNDKYVKIPVWLAALLLTVILAVTGDTLRTVYAVKSDLRVLRTALAAKGIIDPRVCKAENPAKLLHIRGIVANPSNHVNQNKQKTAVITRNESDKKIIY